MPIITWNETYSVGVPDIDEQHQRWISLINALHDAMSSGKGRAYLQTAFQEVVDYTQTHFAYEEKKLATCSYPGLAAHRKIHEEMTNKVLNMQKRYENGDLALTIEVMQFLRDWLTDHIMETDKKYSAFLMKG